MVIMCIQNLLSNTETWAKPTSTFSPLKENMLKKEKILTRFFSATKINIYLFHWNTHVQSIGARLTTLQQKCIFFSEEKLPEKIFIMKTR